MNSGIYRIRNIKNNKVYIGSAIDLFSREQAHFSLLKFGKHHNCHLQRSYNKYGDLCFVFEIIEYVDNIDLLLIKENFYIEKYKSFDENYGYNIRKIADNNIGIKYSNESRLKMSKSQKGKRLSQETKQKISNANKGRILSQETKDKMSISKMGHIVSLETRIKMSKPHRKD